MLKILVIDDEKDVVEMLKDFLQRRGFAVIPAYDGDEGLTKLDAEKPDLVICDIKMPRMDGFKFLKEVRTSRKWVPVIILSAVSEPASILKGYDLQADYYVTKPLDLEETLKAVQFMVSLIPLRKE